MILRAAAFGLALATAAGGVAVALREPWRVPPAPASSPVDADGTRLAVPAAAPALSCSGPETAIAPAGSEPQAPAGPITLTAVADGTGSARATLGSLGGAASPVPGRTEPSTGVRVLQTPGDVTAPLRLAAAPDAVDARLAAVQTTFARTGDRRGLAAGACAAATTDAWLVGAATSSGRRARLLLLDPTPAPAVVDVVVLGPQGPVDLPSARGLVVAAGHARAVQLDALAPGLDRIAVHVLARRGRVAAILDDSRLDGATPAGVDDVPVAAASSRHLTLPGVVVPSVPAPGSATAVVRLAVPGGDDAVVHLHLAGPQPDTPLPGNGVVTVPAGSVVDVPLTGLQPGSYAVLADADVPLVGGAVVRVAGAPAGALRRAAADIGWTASASPLTGDSLVALPRPVGNGPHGLAPVASSVQLALTAGNADVDVVVRQLGTHGEALGQTPVHVAASRTAAIAVQPAAAAVSVTTGAGTGGPLWAGVAAVAADAAGAMIALVPVDPPGPPDHVALVAVPDPWLPA